MEAQDEYIEKDMLEKRQYMQIVHDGEGEEARGREYTSIFELSEHGVASEWSNGNEADVEKGVEVEVEVDTDLVRRELQVSQLLSSSQNAYNKGFEYDQNVQVVRSIVFHWHVYSHLLNKTALTDTYIHIYSIRQHSLTRIFTSTQ